MRHLNPLLLTTTALLFLTACSEVGDTFEQSVRSGTIADEFIEAPLTEKAQKYELALDTSNEFMMLWEQQDFQSIHDELVHPEVQELLSVDKLKEIHMNLQENYGELVEYKPMQWAFEPKRAKKEYFLFSIKIVQHENKRMNYLIQYLLDGGFKKIIGFYVRETPKLRAPGQIKTY